MIEGIQLHLFADASNLACCAATVAVVEHKSGTVKGLLTSKSRISKKNTTIPRLELVSGQMAANMARNLYHALLRLPVKSIIIWMDSMVTLYWLSNPGKPWKTFVTNRVKKIAEITNEIGLVWKYCPSSENLADLGSRGATIHKMVKDGWFTGPEWLLHVEQWPKQPQLKVATHVSEESKPSMVEVFFTKEREPDEWDALLERSSYWRTLRVTAWALRFLHNCLAKQRKEKRKSGPIGNEEIKKTLHKTLGKSHLFFEGLESVVLNIESNMNNRPFTYVECDGGEEQVLTPNILVRGENSYMFNDVEDEEAGLTKMQRRLRKAKDDAWKRWKREYVYSLLESQRVNNKVVEAPQIGDVVLVVGEEKNRGEWKKRGSASTSSWKGRCSQELCCCTKGILLNDHYS